MSLGRFCFYVLVTAVTFVSPTTDLWGGGKDALLESPSEIAAGQWLDSFFETNAPTSLMLESNPRRHTRGLPKRRAAARTRLVRNPESKDGAPPYALIDRYGGVQRYVEPVETVDLEAHLGQHVAIRHDTGDTLLASQLDLPLVAGKARAPGLKLVEFQEEIPTPAGEGNIDESIIIPEGSGPIYLDETVEGDLDFGGCASCGRYGCRPQGACAPCARGALYARGEYLSWWFDGMYIPRLVVRGGGAFNSDPPPTLVFADAEVVYGNQDILKDTRDGGRVVLGAWLDDCCSWAVEADYFGFNESTSRFVDGGTDDTFPGPPGAPFVGRPYVDATTGLDAVEDVYFPGLIGFVTVDARSEFQSFGIRARHSLCCAEGCSVGCGDCVDCGDSIGCGSSVGCGTEVGFFPGIRGWFAGSTRRIDMLMGIRYARLNEGLSITEDLVSTTGNPDNLPPGVVIHLNDNFATSNEFFGAELGFLCEWEYRRWSLELLSKLAIGNTRQRVDISGSTTRSEGDPLTKVGGLLAQSTNIGQYSRNEFGVIPEIGVTLGYQVTKRLRATFGYTLLYWSSVARPGDQIDLAVNPALLNFPPPAAPLPASPAFVFRDTGFWGHGFNVGGEYRW